MFLNSSVGDLRLLRAVYAEDPLIREVTTNLLANLILIDTE